MLQLHVSVRALELSHYPVFGGMASTELGELVQEEEKKRKRADFYKLNNQEILYHGIATVHPMTLFDRCRYKSRVDKIELTSMTPGS